MGTIEVTPGRPAAAREPATDAAVDVCFFCRRPAGKVTLVVRDPAHNYNVCAACLDDCAKTVACMCVC